MSEEQSLNLAKKINSDIQLAELNELLQKTVVLGPNTLIFASGPDKADVNMPNDEILSIIMYGVGKKQLEPYEDITTDKPLITKNIRAGRVTKESKNTALDAIEWTLSNGAKVVLKSTPFQQDEISLQSFSFGGFSLLSTADWEATRNLMGMLAPANPGVGEFDRTTLRKMLTGKKVSVIPAIGELSQVMSGSCSPKDLETLLQLVHLYFTAPRLEQSEFDLSIGRLRNHVKNRNIDPANAFRDTLSNLLNNYHPRAQAITEEGADKLSLAKIREVYKQRFANPAAFTFIFTGNIDPKTAKPLVEKYLGSLTGNKKESYKDHNLYPVKGEVKRHFQRAMQVEKASVNVVYTGEIANTIENSMALNYLSRILRLRYTEEIREKRGGTYGASVRGSISTLPKERFNLSITFDTDPKMMEELVEVAHDELRKIAENGPLPEDFQKTEGNMKSQFEQNLKENAYWGSVLYTYYLHGRDTHSRWMEVFAKTDAEAIQNIAKEILKQGNSIEVVMMPE
jgi:zinc protease